MSRDKKHYAWLLRNIADEIEAGCWDNVDIVVKNSYTKKFTPEGMYNGVDLDGRAVSISLSKMNEERFDKFR